MPATTLHPDDRGFFQRLTDDIYSNPFEAKVAEQTTSLTTSTVASDEGHQHHLNNLVPAMNERIARLESAGLSRLQDFHQADRPLLAYVYLFQTYHRSLDDLDTLIQLQLEQDDPAEVPFAEQVLAQLKVRGFQEAECTRYLGLFYQLRRAYYFIAHFLVGDSPCMHSLRCALWNTVFTYDVRQYDQSLWNRMEDFSTLLLGETGSGKGAAAAAIGKSAFIPFDRKTGCFSDNFNQTFISINLSQYPESLIESELFGHRKGAFTGAVDNHQGVFERCSRHGALFLDEIGDVSIPVQIKLLRVLQERIFTPVGGHAWKRFSGRVIAATNKSLAQARRDGDFRNDFYYRLCSDVIEVPSLQQRIQENPEELECMVGLLVGRLVAKNQQHISELVMKQLRACIPPDYAWPGNVRELEQAVRRILLSRYYSTETVTEVASSHNGWTKRLEKGDLTARELLAAYCRQLYEKLDSYEEVARMTRLDRRTVKKYIQAASEMVAASSE